MLRERTLGNSSTRLAKQLRENHGVQWLQHYLEVSPPEPVAVPTNRWLPTVYGKDLMSRMDHIKASITSTFGSILKMDSTKKMTKKLAGAAKGTALWVSSVSNEVGQVLISVLTAQEGPGLDRMVSDLIRRYSEAGVAPPLLLYVDCGCCREAGRETKLKARFSGWPDLIIRLDIWHFLRRLFLASLSVCLVEWDPANVALLRQAKREELRKEGVPVVSDSLVDSRITKAQLAQYCRRRTRGEEATIRLVERLLQELMGDRGRDLLGVPLLDRVRMEHIWRVQKRHVKCIQDPGPGVSLYTETGTTTTKEGVLLTKYRCARGSTSLESFHCHLNRFIPGTQANDLNFQLYLLDGLTRWNQDRAAAAVAEKMSALLSYSGDLGVQCVNTYGSKVFGRNYVPSFRPPAKYTGGLDEAEDEGFLDEGFREDAVDPTVTSLEVVSAFLSTAPPALSCPPPVVPGPLFRLPLLHRHHHLLSPPPMVLALPGKLLHLLHHHLPSRSPVVPGPLLHRLHHLPSPPLVVPGPLLHLPSHLLSPLQAVDVNNIPGLDRVDRLAEYLVGVRNQTSLALSNQDVSSIVGMWKDLLPYDQQKVVFAARHRLLTGRFRTPKKKAEFTPGVESVRRCSIASSASPAQWPDCCRLVESIFVRLCNIHKSPSKKGKMDKHLTRWTLILQDYRRIRQLILANGAVMTSTSMQLVEEPDHPHPMAQ
ncbi:hypothetical protein N1851_033466 [Merluccius polli]|uniref:Uncharacterized protein n=1 Tax=Merluccius polli TaxID=89951 RepID=A0AA47NNJ7_MERPO|nr:hypothetical protein N1851_033466 [Merluccius polli]